MRYMGVMTFMKSISIPFLDHTAPALWQQRFAKDRDGNLAHFQFLGAFLNESFGLEDIITTRFKVAHKSFFSRPL